MLEFLPEAKLEAEDATIFRGEVESVCAAIARQPLLWRERIGGFRRVNLPGFPYYVAYLIRGDRILVAAIGHSSRHPNYWKRRAI